MAKLAIKGHATRGKEVIETLKMLGGNNANNCYGKYYDRVYYINENGYIDQDFVSHIEQSTKFIIYTLEQFEEKFPYKVGDKVVIKCKNQEAIIDRVDWCCDTITYWLKYDGIIEGNRRVEHLQPYKEKENMEEKLIPKIDFNDHCKDKYLLDLGNYEIKDENGKTYVVRKQPQYPKTYEECCEVLGINPTYGLLHDDNRVILAYKIKKIAYLQELLICRDAYWKIAGDWKPNLSEDFIYSIGTCYGTIEKRMVSGGSGVLLFSTEEMRDAFYENFKEYIETVKELL